MSDRDRTSRFKGPKTGGRGGDRDRERPERQAKPQGGRPHWRDRDAKGGGKGHAKGEGPVILYGWHSVTMALANPQRHIRKLFVTENVARRLADEKIDTRVPPELMHPGDIDRRLGPDAVHQGLLAEADPLPGLHLDELPQDGIVLVLDQITDPHNVGAILRSAAAFDALGIVTQDRHAPPESGTVARAASGALEVVPWCRVINLARALEEIAEAGFWRVGLTGHASQTLDQAMGNQKLALVLGAEGEGMRQNTEAHCDELAKLPISGKVESLNVSNAAAIALYAAITRKED